MLPARLHGYDLIKPEIHQKHPRIGWLHSFFNENLTNVTIRKHSQQKIYGRFLKNQGIC